MPLLTKDSSSSLICSEHISILPFPTCGDASYSCSAFSRVSGSSECLGYTMKAFPKTPAACPNAGAIQLKTPLSALILHSISDVRT
jgi:hypothetical protein